MVAVCPAASFTRPRTLGTATLGAFVLAVTVVRAVDGAQLRPALEEHQHQKKKAYGWHQQHLASGGGVLARTSTAINGGAAIVTTACTAGQIVLDDCAFKNDDACDADSFVCNAGTDCFDCDPCRLYDDTSCDTCLNGGSSASTTTTTNSSTTTTPSCVWCAQPGGAAAGICASTDVAAAFPWVCSADGGTDFFDVCANVPVVEIPSCDIVNDICVFNEDLVCDVASNICPMGSDCFDCDPCLKLTSCQACTALNTNCTWCSTSDVTTGGVCSSLDIAAAVPNFCLDLTAGTAYSTTCTDTGGTTPTSPISSFSPSPTSLSTPAPSGSTLAPSPSLSTPTTTTTCNLDTDTCYSSFQFDLVCDADGSLCPLGSDCFDCDPCQLYAAVEDCNACVEAGCQYATYPTILGFFRAICSSPEIAAAVPNIAVNEGGTPYQSTCDGSGGGGDDDGGGEGTCNFATDSCMLQQNGACDADGTLCPISSDCFDCDPCKANNSLGCDACTQTTGCMWCSNGDDVTGQCSSTDSAKAFPNVCGTSGTTFSSVCNGGGGGGTSTTPYTCDATNDPCLYTMDGVCDANGLICALQDSDCVDCDPCQKYRFEGCEVCTGASEGCLWCDVDAMCKSPGLVLPGTMMTCAETDFVSTCPAPTTVGTLVFSDPLFGSMNWLYDQIKVKDVWASGITGAGVGIRVNDDGIDTSHPEFSSKFDEASSCSIHTPFTSDSKHSHGTTCASLAAGSGNDSCSVGVAPDATLSGCRAILTASGEELSPEVSDRSFLYINMEQMHVSSNSYGIPSCRLVEASRERRLQTSCPFSSTSPNSPCQSADCAGVDWSNPSPYPQCESTITIYCRINFEYDVQACTSFLDLFVQCQYGSQSIEEHDAFVKGITEGRDGKGIIYVFASGNDYAYGADVNFEGALNSRFVISVGAVGKDTVHASYSNGGAPLFVSGPGGDSETYTTNVVALAGGGCTDGGVGTSFATPVVSGVVALILQANPNLSWRDMQGVLALTSQQVQPDDSSWTTNAAGFHHSYLYGFGLIDASAAVGAAKTWAGFLNEIQIIEESGVVDVSIPEFPNDPVSSTITVQTGDTFVTESVIVYLDLVHSSRGDLEVVLVSPSGTESILAPGQRPENAQSEERWKLMTVRNWGESANGEWTLRLVDRSAGDVASCVDVSGWSIDLGDPGDPLVFDCGDFAFLKICEAGAQGPGFYRYFATTATSISDPYFTNANGTSLTEACCECGGGVLATSVGDTLTSWKIAVYGHDGNSVAATPTTSATPTATTTAGSNPSGTSAGFGNSQPSATSTTGVVPSTSVGAPSVAAVSPTDAYRSSSAANGDNGRRFSMVGGFLFALLYVVLYI